VTGIAQVATLLLTMATCVKAIVRISLHSMPCFLVHFASKSGWNLAWFPVQWHRAFLGRLGFRSLVSLAWRLHQRGVDDRAAVSLMPAPLPPMNCPVLPVDPCSLSRRAD
jgi:hypothetical protein